MGAVEQLNASLAGRYTVEREIGKGGMATVYLARDVKHDRNVAIKVLLPELGAILGVERFQAEIKVTANLQHPNLLPLFDSGEADGLLFYVMPYVEGESLRARLDREKQLPIDEALRIAGAVANALDYAHRHEVIHRDLKPENVLLHDGQPLVADFGIALAVSKAGGARITQTGLSLGTPQYMSPEQATGDRAIDGRTDIYSLGAMTYEMLTGEPPHVGSTSQAIIARVLTEKPRGIRMSRPNVPEHVEAAVERALEKLPADRFASAHEFADALSGKAIVGKPLGATQPTQGASASTVRSWRAVVRHPAGIALLVAAVVGLAGTATVWRLARREMPRNTVRFELGFEAPQLPLLNRLGSPFALSPDGKLLAYVAVPGTGARRLYIRPLAELRARELAGTEGASQPFFSPDGGWLGFESGGQLKKVLVAGGSVVLLGEVPRFAGASWVRPGEIVASVGGQVVAIPAVGGAPRVVAGALTALGSGLLVRNPLVLPGEKSVVYSLWSNNLGIGARLVAVALDGGEPRDLTLAGNSPLALLEGKLVYATSGGAIMSVSFDVGSVTATGTPVPVVDGVSTVLGGAPQAAVSRSGTLVYASGAVGGGSQLVLTTRGSSGRPVFPEPRPYAYPRFSPDGRQLAFSVGGDRTDVWVADLPSGPARRLSRDADGTLNDRPEWTPDGLDLLFRSNRGGRNAIWRQPADGHRDAELVMQVASGAVDEGVLSADGDFLILQVDTTRCNCAGTSFYRRVRGDTTLVPLAPNDRGQQTTARIAPNGRWVAYRTNEMGTAQVFVKPFPALDARYQVSTDVGETPVWSRDGRRLYYVSGERLIAASLAFAPGFSVVAHDTLLSGIVAGPIGPASANHANFDVSPDGKSFVVIRGSAMDAKVILVHDWKYELRTRTGTPGTRP